MDAAAAAVLTYRQAQAECKRLGLPAKGWVLIVRYCIVMK